MGGQSVECEREGEVEVLKKWEREMIRGGRETSEQKYFCLLDG